MGQERAVIGRLRHWHEDRTPGRSEPTKGREMRACCSDRDRKEPSMPPRRHTIRAGEAHFGCVERNNAQRPHGPYDRYTHMSVQWQRTKRWGPIEGACRHTEGVQRPAANHAADARTRVCGVWHTEHRGPNKARVKAIQVSTRATT
ncbi:hypothetical protein V6N13_098927 [Hibiscus sabdariffa]|uniref:Uncharacterized protein n=1 Tax=Hibiscus sabdariffa TaxID=183260 RepID=A0ABR1ZH98_9ROSI